MNEQSVQKRRIRYFLIGFFILIVVRVFIYNAFDKSIVDDTTRLLVSEIYKFFIWVAPVFLYLILVDKTNPFTYLKLNTSPKNGLIWTLCVVAIGVIWQILEIHFRGDQIGHISLNTVLGLVFIPLFEEIPMRGFILNKLAEIMPFAKALFISAGFFLLVHLPGWFLIAPAKPISQMLIDSIAVFVILGLVGGLLMKKSNSLYPSIVLHAVNNFISSV
jgi:uncharacterized protein